MDKARLGIAHGATRTKPARVVGLISVSSAFVSPVLRRLGGARPPCKASGWRRVPGRTSINSLQSLS